MITKEDLDALGQSIDQVATDLTTTKNELQTEIDALAAANPNLDLSPVRAKVDALDQMAVALGDLKPTPQEPPTP